MGNASRKPSVEDLDSCVKAEFDALGRWPRSRMVDGHSESELCWSGKICTQNGEQETEAHSQRRGERWPGPVLPRELRLPNGADGKLEIVRVQVKDLRQKP